MLVAEGGSGRGPPRQVDTALSPLQVQSEAYSWSAYVVADALSRIF